MRFIRCLPKNGEKCHSYGAYPKGAKKGHMCGYLKILFIYLLPQGPKCAIYMLPTLKWSKYCKGARLCFYLSAERGG